jgi:hypothetical protein
VLSAAPLTMPTATGRIADDKHEQRRPRQRAMRYPKQRSQSVWANNDGPADSCPRVESSLPQMWIHRGLGQGWYSPWGVRQELHGWLVSPVPVDSVSCYPEGKAWLQGTGSGLFFSSFIHTVIPGIQAVWFWEI